MISNIVIAALAVSALFSIGIPVLYFFYYKVKLKANLSPMFLGMVVCLVMQGLVTVLFSNSTGDFSRIFLEAIIVSAILGTFINTLTYVVFKKLPEEKKKPENSLMYGLGAGGIYVIISSAIYNIYPIIYAAAVNWGYFSTDDELSALEYLQSATVSDILFSGLEHFIYITMQICFSVLVYYASTNKENKKIMTVIILANIAILFLVDISSYFMPSVMVELMYIGFLGIAAICAYGKYGELISDEKN